MNLGKLVYLPGGQVREKRMRGWFELAEEGAAGTGSAYPIPSASSLSPKLS